MRTALPLTDQVREILADAGFRRQVKVLCRKVGDGRYRVAVSPPGYAAWDPIVWSALHSIVVQTFRDSGAYLSQYSMIFTWKP